jgi:uncharacterized protein with ParB-like and HNH nuclease domain
MKNIETPDKMHLGKLVEELRYGSYVIPDFQREFIWEPWDVSELLRSIFEDYFIGTLLLWKASLENQNLLSCEPIYGFTLKSDPKHIVLDGQQRLSALYYAFFSPDAPFPRRKKKCYFFVNISRLENNDFENAFTYEWSSRSTLDLLNDRNKQFENKIFPMNVIGESYSSWMEWVKDYERYWDEKRTNKIGVENFSFENLLKDLMNNYDISFIELDRDIEVSKVCDIFTKINSTGVDLSIFDLLNAMLRPKGLFLKEMWKKISNRYSITNDQRMRLYILQTMSILKQDYCSPKYLYFLVPGAV